jgi:hypothetical protein
LSRYINPDTAGKQRNKLTRSIVLAIRELMKQPEPNATARDLAAFLALALEEINEGVDASVQAWEKRGYWVKADRFRMDWEWTGRLGMGFRTALLNEDWATIAGLAAQVAQKLSTITIAERNRIGEPWVGAYRVLQNAK